MADPCKWAVLDMKLARLVVVRAIAFLALLGIGISFVYMGK